MVFPSSDFILLCVFLFTSFVSFQLNVHVSVLALDITQMAEVIEGVAQDGAQIEDFVNIWNTAEVESILEEADANKVIKGHFICGSKEINGKL